MISLKDQLAKKLAVEIDDVTVQAHEPSGLLCLFCNGKEFAHFHRESNELDIRLTREVIRREGLVHPADSTQHPTRSPNSQWIELRFAKRSDFDEIVRLVGLAAGRLQN